MSSILLLAETGSDITPELAKRYHIRLVPMHVAFDTETKDDGSFPPEEIRDYYRRTGKLPTTSGSTPEDFARVFDAIHAEDGVFCYENLFTDFAPARVGRRRPSGCQRSPSPPPGRACLVGTLHLSRGGEI